ERPLWEIYKLPEEGDTKPLRGTENAFRLRAGDYRIIYETAHAVLTVTVLEAGNRGDAYK
ncbi:MAG: type II toxin-antitoxin system RelE/ParE family toxin, partial [Oscillospiraceae bacterium]|nr:type II toxin-antitoxin system RelE/ParE family toxin [Oscillospiraceae bacterium]